MSHYLYILRSLKTGKYYLGQTHDLSSRLSEHNSDDNEGFTKRDKPWELVFTMDCINQRAAMQIEMNLKKRKSRVFLERLMLEPELKDYLIKKHNDCHSWPL